MLHGAPGLRLRVPPGARVVARGRCPQGTEQGLPLMVLEAQDVEITSEALQTSLDAMALVLRAGRRDPNGERELCEPEII